MSDSVSWNILPIPVIAIVYSYLSLKEKFVVSTTCKAWREALFTTRNLKIKKLKLSLTCSGFKKTKQNPEDVIELFKKFGKYCTCLFVNWCNCYDNQINIFFSSVHWQSFHAQSMSVASLGKLYCLKKNAGKYAVNNFPNKNSSETLITVVSMLRNLQSFSVGFRCNEKFFEEFQKCCFGNLEILHMAFIITNGHLNKPSIYCDYKWIKTLRVLTINYEYISPNLLESLSTAKQITELTLLLQGTEPNKLPDNAWKNMKSSMPHLQIGMVIVEVENSKNVVWSLGQAVNLQFLTLIYETPNFFTYVFMHMKSLYQDCLEKVSIYYLEKTTEKCAQSWLYAFENNFPKVKQICLNGMPVFPDELVTLAMDRAWTNEPLEKLVVPAEEIYVDSQCSSNLYLQISARQLRKLETEMSEIFQQPWKASRDNFLWRKKRKHFSFKDIMLGILQSKEDS